MRVLGYLRQSKARKRPGEAAETRDDSLSLDGQATRFRQWCATNGAMPLDPTIRDHDLTGDDPNRPGIAELFARVEAERPDVVWVFALSRFARDHVWQELAWRRLRDLGARLVSDTEPHAENDLMRGMLGVVNAYAKQEKSAFVAMAIAQRVRRGIFWGRPPYGYAAAERGLVVDDDDSAVVALIFERWRDGWSLRRIAEQFNADGLPAPLGDAWAPNTIKKIIHNPVYAGVVRLDGALLPGAHPAIVERADWERAQAAFTARPILRTKAVTSWLDGRVRHTCGARMYLIAVTVGSGAVKPAFRCRTRALPSVCHCGRDRPQLSAAKCEAAARLALAIDLAGACPVADAIARRWADVGGAATLAARREVEARRADLLAQRRRVEELYTTGRRNLAWFDAREAIVGGELAALDARAAALPSPPDEAAYRETAAAIASFGAGIAGASDATLARLIAAAGTVIVGGDGVRIVYASPWAEYVVAPVTIPIGRSTARVGGPS